MQRSPPKTRTPRHAPCPIFKAFYPNRKRNRSLRSRWNNLLCKLWNLTLRIKWNEINPSPPQRFHTPQAYFTPAGHFTNPERDLFRLKKALAFASAFFLAPPVGLEPTTLRLTAACSTDWAKEECFYRPVLVGGNLCRRRLIFPGGYPPSIVSTNELNYRVRNGNGWTLIVIDTDSIFNAFHVKSIYHTSLARCFLWWPVRDSNPCCRRERPES